MAPRGHATIEERLNDAASCLLCLAEGSLERCPHGPSRPAEVRVLEMEAFGSVQDLIHASISARGGRSTLAQIYQLCHSRGRIAYKRSGGSRLITHNEHWKSQIRHALCADDQDAWELTPGRVCAPPSIVRVLVREDAPDVPDRKEGVGTSGSARLSDQAAAPATATATVFDERSLTSRAAGGAQLSTPLPVGDCRGRARRGASTATAASSRPATAASSRPARRAGARSDEDRPASLGDECGSLEVEQPCAEGPRGAALASPDSSSSRTGRAPARRRGADPPALRWGRTACRSAVSRPTLPSPPARWTKKARRGSRPSKSPTPTWESARAAAGAGWEPQDLLLARQFHDLRTAQLLARAGSPASARTYDDAYGLAGAPPRVHIPEPYAAASPALTSAATLAGFVNSGSVSPSAAAEQQRRAAEQLQAMLASIARAADQARHLR